MTWTPDTVVEAAQASILGVLLNDPTLAGLVGDRLYDAVPDAPAFPYLAFEEWTDTPSRTLEDGAAGYGHDATVTLTVWTDDTGSEAGAAPGARIMSRVVALLDGYAITVAGHVTVMLELQQTTTFRHPDEPWRGTSSEWRLLVEDA